MATSFSVKALLAGLGRHDRFLEPWQASSALKFYVIWIFNYITALAIVKSAVCVTILFVTSTKPRLRVAIYALLATTWASFFITIIGTLLYCRPVSTIWTGQGKCAPVATFVILGHVATVSTILTDLGLVIVPAMILWDTQMKKQQKLQALALLSFASV